MSLTAELVAIGVALAAAATPGCGEGRAGQLTVRVYREGNGVPAARVVVHRPDGAVASVTLTDAEGVARPTVGDGDLLTVAHGTAVYQLVTVVGATAGTEVVVGEAAEHRDPAEQRTLRVTVPGPWPGAARYLVGTGDPCPVAASETAGVVDLETYNLCVGRGGDLGVVARALAAGGATLAVTTARTSRSSAAVALPPWRPDPGTIVSIAGAPATVSRAVTLAPIADGVEFDAPTTDATVPAPTLAPFADAMRYDVLLRQGDAVTRRLDRTAPAAELPLRFATDFLPLLGPASLDRTDPARPIVVGGEGGAGQGADARVVQLVWPPDTAAHEWTVVLPADRPAGFRFPALPDEMADWRPTGEVRLGVAVVDASDVAGLAALLRVGLPSLAGPSESDRSVRLSSWGDVRL